ncbi:MAG: hypothetical protein MUD10_02715 [Candidatus Pacebacteria bacterium]|jgi:hypothetical protein|nr:hypothetical protein [Candidatus Paceibacterota bacterium]
MKKILLVLGLLFIATPVMAATEIWSGGRCNYVTYLSRCCLGGIHIYYYADGAKDTPCYIEYSPTTCVLNEPGMVYNVQSAKVFTKAMSLQNKAPDCPTRAIFRNTHASPVASFAHYENEVLIENNSTNTPKTATVADKTISKTTVADQVVYHKSGVATATTMTKPVVSATSSLVQAVKQPSAASVKAFNTKATTLEGLNARINQIIAMILELQRQLLLLKVQGGAAS